MDVPVIIDRKEIAKRILGLERLIDARYGSRYASLVVDLLALIVLLKSFGYRNRKRPLTVDESLLLDRFSASEHSAKYAVDVIKELAKSRD